MVVLVEASFRLLTTKLLEGKLGGHSNSVQTPAFPGTLNAQSKEALVRQQQEHLQHGMSEEPVMDGRYVPDGRN